MGSWDNRTLDGVARPDLSSDDSCEDYVSISSEDDVNTLPAEQPSFQLDAFIRRPARDDPFSSWSAHYIDFWCTWPFRCTDSTLSLAIFSLAEYLRRCVLMLLVQGYRMDNRHPAAGPISTNTQSRSARIRTGSMQFDLRGIGTQFENY
ncbi:hypothetical protein NW762_000404 [Fusarium torreyae]|uniref:Uncharacterized protein n=1 Tax=Fusarium torreyae TaxID=1237075 RepID=A0A9W8VQP9_9HYPO|nr:hypothetical protein NW762_000404 [Fusarium torreyae]